MPTAEIEYHAPDSLDRAIALLAEHGPAAAPLAGGTDLVPALKHGVSPARHLVSLKRIPGFRGISLTSAGDLSIGAFATLGEIADSQLVGEMCPALAEAAAQAGSPILRNRGTIGGNVCLETRCWYYNQSEAWRASRPLCQKAGGEECYVNPKENRCVALFSADTPPALIAAAGRATLVGPEGERTVAVEDLYSGDALKPIAKAPAEILTAITLPAALRRWGTAYLKHSARESIDFPILGVAAAVELGEDDTLGAVRVALTGAKSAPGRLADFEVALRGRPAPADGDRELAALAARSVGALFLSDAVPHKRKLAGLIAVQAVGHAAARARSRRAA